MNPRCRAGARQSSAAGLDAGGRPADARCARAPRFRGAICRRPACRAVSRDICATVGVNGRESGRHTPVANTLLDLSLHTWCPIHFNAPCDHLCRLRAALNSPATGADLLRTGLTPSSNATGVPLLLSIMRVGVCSWVSTHCSLGARHPGRHAGIESRCRPMLDAAGLLCCVS